MDTFTNSNYSITSSLNERTIYLKIIDTMQYLSYEGNIELKELKLPITLKDAYTLITKCLSNTDEHLVKYSKNTNILRLDFTAKVGGYMNISFDVMLRECIIGDDAKMSMKLFEMEVSNRKKSEELEKTCQDLKYTLKMTASKIEEMQTIIEKQGEMIELFGNIKIYTYRSPVHNDYRFLKMNSETVNYVNDGEINQFILFYNCIKLVIEYHTDNLEKFCNNNVEELKCGHINSLKGIHNMPNLKIINISPHPTMNNYTEQLLKYLKEYDNKITQIIITNPNKPDPTELQRYCKEKGIELIIQ
jgi:hypothetical protein